MNYFIRKSGVVSGPFPEEDVRRRLQLNLLTSMDEASIDGRTWKRIRQTPLWSPPTSAAPTGISGRAFASGKSAPTTPASLHLRREAKREMAATARPMAAPSAFSRPSSSSGSVRSDLPSSGADSPRAVIRERRRFGNWWLALAIPCATVVVLALIGAIVGDDSGTGGASGGIGNIADDGYRGEEVSTLNLNNFKPEFHDFLLYITPSYSELKQTFRMVETSEHVSENLDYESKMEGVRFYHDPSDNQINAYATVFDNWYRPEPEICPCIMVCGGAGRFARVIGAAMAEFGDDLDVDALLGALGSAGSLDNEQALYLLSEVLHVPMEHYSDPAWLANAKGVSRGVLMAILAHETGHIALGHVWAWQKNLERSRNQEREADSFAHSVASGTADAESMFLGNFLFHYAFAINEGRNGNPAVAREHPYSEERLLNLVRDNKSIADLYGISESDIRDRLREARAKFN